MISKPKPMVGDVVKVNPERGSDFRNVLWLVTGFGSNNEAKIKRIDTTIDKHLPLIETFYFAHLYTDGDCVKKKLELKREKNAKSQMIGRNRW